MRLVAPALTAVLFLLWGAPAMAGSDECIWAALPESKMAALEMTDEVWGSAEGSMVNIVGDEAFVSAFEACSLGDEDYGGPSTQSLDQYVAQLRAEKTLSDVVSPDVLDKAFIAVPEADLRKAFDLLFVDVNKAAAMDRVVMDLFLASLPEDLVNMRRDDAETYLRARVARFTWSVLMPERMRSAVGG